MKQQCKTLKYQFKVGKYPHETLLNASLTQEVPRSWSEEYELSYQGVRVYVHGFLDLLLMRQIMWD